jgi:4-amino-4-deoxy-L-arabinose transferase-like glycosyltransferase
MQGEVRATTDPVSAVAGVGHLGRIFRGSGGLLLAASAVIIFYAMAVAIPNVFTVDGLIYVAMAEAMAESGTFEISNGYEAYRSQNLDLMFLVPVEGGLVPQYPGGWAFLAAPFYMLGGVRGLFLLNALATVGTIWLIHATSRELFENPRAAMAAALIFVFATFAFDYAGAVWPHAVTVVGIAAATAAAARAWRRGSPLWALASGLAVGVAINFRVDAGFAAPVIGFWLLAASSRPWANAGAFAAGMLPGLLASAIVNLVKFGIFSPVTYGRSGDSGATSLAFYADLLPFAAAVAIPLLLLGSRRVRRIAYRPGVLAALAVALAVVSLLPGFRPVVLRLLTGTAALVIDIQTFRDVFQANLVTEMPDGTITLFGYPKKALLQSLPWLAGCLVLVPGLLRGRDRAALALLVLLPLALVLPFAWSAWFGGRGNHMRYMVNLFPALTMPPAGAAPEVRR